MSPKKREGQPPIHWQCVRDAATVLGTTPAALRKRLERNAARAPDGVVEANFDAVRGRKFGGHWRVALGVGWTG